MTERDNEITKQRYNEKKNCYGDTTLWILLVGHVGAC